MATNPSLCLESYVLDQFPSDVMFGMKGFHVSASGAIQGHHGLLVFILAEFIRIILYMPRQLARGSHGYLPLHLTIQC